MSLPVKTVFAAQLVAGQQFEDVFLVAKKSLAETKAGKPYLALSLMDRTGEVEARIWDNAQLFAEQAEEGGYVLVQAVAKPFREQMQLGISSLRKVADSDVDLADFLPTSSRSLEEMAQELERVLDAINDQPLVQLLRTIFQRMRQLRAFADAGLAGRTWDQATRMVMAGQALLQVQGTWVNGEFTSRRMVPGRQFACFLFPDTQGIYLFNADQYVFFQGAAMADATRGRFAATLMDTGLQRDLNIATGAAPARVDVALEPFNACGQQLIRHLRASNMRRTVLGSVAMGNANPPAVKTAIYQLVHAHFTGAIDDETAIARLQAAISGTASE